MPIPLLIVDINMPFDGFQVVSHIFTLYEKLNKRIREKFEESIDRSSNEEVANDSNEPNIVILRPLICYLSGE